MCLFLDFYLRKKLVLSQLASLLAILSALSPATNADALCSHGTGDFAGSMISTNTAYQQNRAAFNARGITGKRVKFCVLVEGQPKRVNQSRLREFKRAPIEALVGALVDCDQPATLAFAQVKPEKRQQVLAYLTEKYRLFPSTRALEKLLAKRQSPDFDAAVARAD